MKVIIFFIKVHVNNHYVNFHISIKLTLQNSLIIYLHIKHKIKKKKTGIQNMKKSNQNLCKKKEFNLTKKKKFVSIMKKI